MEDILKSIELSLQNENWYSALVLSLVLPDICGKLQYPDKKSQKRYSEWFDKYFGEEYAEYLSGNDCYALRCSYLHEGSSSIEKQQAKEVLDHFIFLSSEAPHRSKISNCSFGSQKYDGKDILQLSVIRFSQDMVDAARQWLGDVSVDQ